MMKAKLLRKILGTTRPVADHGEYIAVGSYLCHNILSVDKKTLKVRYALDTFREGREYLAKKRDEELLQENITEAQITEKHFTASYTTTTVVPAGKVMVPVTTFHPPSWNVRLKNGEHEGTVSVSEGFYYSVNTDQWINVRFRVGRFSGDYYFFGVVEED